MAELGVSGVTEPQLVVLARGDAKEDANPVRVEGQLHGDDVLGAQRGAHEVQQLVAAFAVDIDDVFRVDDGGVARSHGQYHGHFAELGALSREPAR